MVVLWLCTVSSCLRGTEEHGGNSEFCSGGDLHTFLSADNTNAVRISVRISSFLSLSKGLNSVRLAAVELCRLSALQGHHPAWVTLVLLQSCSPVSFLLNKISTFSLRVDLFNGWNCPHWEPFANFTFSVCFFLVSLFSYMVLMDHMAVAGAVSCGLRPWMTIGLVTSKWCPTNNLQLTSFFIIINSFFGAFYLFFFVRFVFIFFLLGGLGWGLVLFSPPRSSSQEDENCREGLWISGLCWRFIRWRGGTRWP